MRKSFPLIFLVSLFFISACTNGKTQSLESFYKDAKIENVDKVVIQDGSTGASKSITEQEKIDEFLSLIKDTEYTPSDNQEQLYGWRYGIVLYDGEKEFKFTPNEIGETYYDSTPDIKPIIENYYEKLDIAEE